MAENETTATPAAGPGLAVEQLQAVQGWFDSSPAMNDAVSKLAMAGFDHADFSLPDANTSDTNLGAPMVATDDDARQARTLAGSLAAAAGAMLAG
ncbi:MAG TPA: hypothetical protein VGD75_02120, partial [Bradyrhizobium sp.]